MAGELAQYTFVPWLRRGLANRIDEADDLGAQTAIASTGRAGIDAELALEHVPVGGAAAAADAAIIKRIELVGPGDVAGVKASAILRTQPQADAASVTPGEFAFVEFYEEDFPWRYTPARAARDTEPDAARFKLRPWLALFVLRQDEFALTRRPDGPGILTLTDEAELPPVTETWAWGHAQIGQPVAGADGVPQAIDDNPDHALSRLMCPRRLVRDTAYHAFLVPAFETGRRSGLGGATAGIPAQQPSWGTPGAEPVFPVYLDWAFTTGSAGDFESLARKLVPQPAGDTFGKRVLDIGDPGYGMPTAAGATAELEGALQPPGFGRSPFPLAPGEPFATRLQALVDFTENVRANGGHLADPILLPPAYGLTYAAVTRVADADGAGELEWLRELNLDPRSRAVAGLGAEIVRRRQDGLMERAWNQVGQLMDANQRLREAELATAVGEALMRKHVAGATQERVLMLTSAMHRGMRTGTAAASVRAVVDASCVPAAAQSAPFKRATRPQRKLMRGLTGAADVGAFQSGLLSGMNAVPEVALSAAPPRPEPEGAIPIGAVRASVTAAQVALAQKQPEPREIFLELLGRELTRRRSATPPEDLSGLAPGTLRAALTQALPGAVPGTDAATVARRTRVQACIDAIGAITADTPDTATIVIAAATFRGEFGEDVAGRTLGGVTVVSDAPPAGAPVSRATTLADVQRFAADLAAFDAAAVAGRPLPAPPGLLPAVADLADGVATRIAPHRSVAERVAFALPGLRHLLLDRPVTAVRRLRPVMAHPVFPDPMFDALRELSQDHIVPNIGDLPRDSLTLLEPNPRYLAAYFAGLNTELGRELLWREFPTDQRGTYFGVFWDTIDALGHAPTDDITPLHTWAGGLDEQSARAGGALVLVIRGELLQKYPNTVIYAQEAEWPGGDTSAPRGLRAGGAVRFPSFHASLDPDVGIFGFQGISAEQARGHRPTGPTDERPAAPGWFFVLKERPGQVRFGLDEAAPKGGLKTWDDLSWEALALPAGTSYPRLADHAGLAPAGPAEATWARSSADMAAILFQSPVLYARHAEEMLPA